MAWIKDISLTVTPDLPVWPGDPQPEITLDRIEEDGAIIHVTSLRLGAHTGTHLDAPLHFIPDGKRVPEIDLTRCIGEVVVVDVGSAEVIDRKLLEDLLPDLRTSRVLFKSDRNRGALLNREFFEEYTALSPDAAAWLVERGVQLVGVDYLSIGRFSGGNKETHETLLSADVVIVEGLDLSSVDPGAYTLVCLPIKLPFDGAPCRAVLLENGALEQL